MTVWFDVEDLFLFVSSGNKRTSGIQRLTIEIYRAAEALAGASGAVRFVRHGRGGALFETVSWAEIARQFAEQESERPAAVPPSRLRRMGRHLALRLPDELRKPLVLASVMQVQAVGELARAGVNLVAHPTGSLVRRASKKRDADAGAPVSLVDAARPGDALLVLGSPWFRRDYGALIRWLRDELRMRFGVLVHDLVPIRRPEWSHAGTPEMFALWHREVLPFCDLVMANSRHTAADVEAFARETGIMLPGAVQVLPIGTGFGIQQASGADSAGLPEPGSYVLFVSTMEARKNHALAVRVWSMLLDEVRRGRRAPEAVPDLVFAGRVGWLVNDFLQQLDNTGWLDGRIRQIPEATDADLRALYAGCLFTIFPSFHEGWGLPVTESLALGKPCLSSNAGALPEAGGELCRYFDPEDLQSAFRAVSALLDDRPGLAAWEAQVKAEFRPTAWTETARALLDMVAALGSAPTESRR